jgi:hypothetical protein
MMTIKIAKRECAVYLTGLGADRIGIGGTAGRMPNNTLTRANLKTPSAAAIAGMLFSVLVIAVFWLLRASIPADPQEPGTWLNSNSGKVALALNLMPFAGKSHSCGSSVFCAIVLVSKKIGSLRRCFSEAGFCSSPCCSPPLQSWGAILIAFAMQPQELIGSATFHFARAAAYSLVNVYMIKMASVFMITASTVAIYTGIAPRWLAILGFALALILLFGSFYISWSFVVFPLWVFLISVSILRDSKDRPLSAPSTESG